MSQESGVRSQEEARARAIAARILELAEESHNCCDKLGLVVNGERLCLWFSGNVTRGQRWWEGPWGEPALDELRELWIEQCPYQRHRDAVREAFVQLRYPPRQTPASSASVRLCVDKTAGPPAQRPAATCDSYPEVQA